MTDSDFRATKTIELSDEVERIREDAVPELTEMRQDIIDEAIDKGYDDWIDAPEEYIKDVNSINERITRLRGYADLFEDILDKDSGARFFITELTTKQVEQIADEVAEASFDIDIQTQQYRGVPKTGHGRILTMQKSIKEAPGCLPTDNDGNPAVRDYPNRLGKWLWERVEDLNSSGTEADIEDFTLKSDWTHSDNS